MKLNLLPSPQYAKATPIEGRSLVEGLKTVYIEAGLEEKIASALAFLPSMQPAAREKAALVLSCTPMEEDAEWFRHPYAAEQGYIIRDCGAQVIITACAAQGLMYGIASLIQLPALQAGFEIKDYPDIRYRANKWLIWAESEIWSYDLGDGYDAVVERIRRKLDVCLKYKINLVYFDGWGADVERFPRYKELMRECNQEAEKRGIRLVFGAYTMGYGLSGHQIGKHFGKVYMNRAPYPDGPLYECMGTFIHDKRNNGIPYIKGREYGTCISNDAQLADKLEELCRFVREIQPGALYLHNMDSCKIDQRLWQARCSECRRRWPSDDLYAADGMAGAFADYFDRLNGALKKERQDLLIFNVSPGYMEYRLEDDEIERATEFWAAVQRYSKVKDGVYPLVRELFQNKRNDEWRIPAMAKKLENFGIINFSGSDGFYSDQLVVPTALIYKMFKGAEVLISASGNYFQEPLQLVNAEYMWNTDNAEELPRSYEEFLARYHDMRLGKDRPALIYGAGGLLEIACQKLYGEAAPQMAEFFGLHGKGGECPVPYACSREIATNCNNVLLHYRWDVPISEEELQAWTERFGEILRLNERGLALLAQAAEKNADAAEYRRIMMLNQPFLSLWYEYLKLYRQLDAYFRGEGAEEGAAEAAAQLMQKAEEEQAHFDALGLEPLDPMEGVFCRRRELLNTLKYNLLLMQKSLKTNQRIPADRAELSDEDWW